jgi:acetyl-CoA acetyltransferase
MGYSRSCNESTAIATEQLGRSSAALPSRSGHTPRSTRTRYSRNLSPSRNTSRLVRSHEPLHLFDCVLPCSGAEPVLVVDAELGRVSGRPLVELLATRELHDAHPKVSLSLPAGFELYADDLFAEVGVDRSDIDFVELYDDYPIMVAMQLGAYGFCREGGSGRLLEDADLSIRGTLPVNTGGGQLSCGQAGAGGGMIGVVEAVQQLHHEAGERQMADACIGLVSGFGLVSFGKGLCTAGAILRRF